MTFVRTIELPAPEVAGRQPLADIAIELDATGRGRPGLGVPGWITTMLRAY